MSDTQNFGFGNFVPGFDFLQNLAKGGSGAMPQMPSMSSWVAPTLNVEDIEKRISELRTVHFWLDQNSKALEATIQALEVQKMTLATLEGMNVSMAELASSLQVKPMEASAFPQPGPSATTAKSAEPDSASGGDKPTAEKAKASAASGAGIDPMQWWSSLTQQFQTIAANALQEATKNASGGDAARSMADAAGQAVETVTRMTEAATGMVTAAKPAKRAPARKTTTASGKTAAPKPARKTSSRPRP
jgi:hypothetical protein